MDSIYKLLQNHLSKIDQNWMSKKKIEFTSSTLYNKEKDIHIYEELKVHQLLGEKFDDNDFLISREVIEEYEEFDSFENTFREYCKLDLLNKKEFTEEYEITRSSYLGKSKIIYGIPDVLIPLLIDLEPFYKDLPHTEVVDFINNVYDESIDVIKNDLESENCDLFNFKRDLVEMLKLELTEINIVKLESAKYCIVHRQKMKFKLTLEDFSAFLRILEKGRIIYEEKNDILDFAEKHFLYLAQGKEDFGRITKEKLIKAMEKHGTPSHLGKGLANISTKINNAIANI